MGDRTATGPGRLLVGVYAVFTLAAGARSAVQIATKFDAAPAAFTLSALAAVVYGVMTVSLARGGRIARRVAVACGVVELVGVVVVGTVSLAVPDDFPEPTVWSAYGVGYGFVPLVLPVLGLWWLRHTARRSTPDR